MLLTCSLAYELFWLTATHWLLWSTHNKYRPDSPFNFLSCPSAERESKRERERETERETERNTPASSSLTHPLMSFGHHHLAFIRYQLYLQDQLCIRIFPPYVRMSVVVDLILPTRSPYDVHPPCTFEDLHPSILSFGAFSYVQNVRTCLRTT